MGHGIDGARLRALRLAMGLGLRELARKAEVDPGLLSRLERGEAPHTSAVELGKICHAAGVSMDEILGYGPSRGEGVREEVIRMLGSTMDPAATAALRDHEPPDGDLSAEYWIHQYRAFDAAARARKPR